MSECMKVTIKYSKRFLLHKISMNISRFYSSIYVQYIGILRCTYHVFRNKVILNLYDIDKY